MGAYGAPGRLPDPPPSGWKQSTSIIPKKAPVGLAAHSVMWGLSKTTQATTTLTKRTSARGNEEPSVESSKKPQQTCVQAEAQGLRAGEESERLSWNPASDD